jgi:hypothetical protein
MKRKHPKIGQQRHKPFPVVQARFRPVGKDVTEVCGMNTCQSLEFFSERPKAAFMVQVCGDRSIVSQSGFTETERGELTWEKAYRDQVAGKEPEPIGYPVFMREHLPITPILRYLWLPEPEPAPDNRFIGNPMPRVSAY